jgi:predicted SAM-dependent methyltransferase
MASISQIGRKILNTLIAPFGIEIIRSYRPDLHLYSELSRPEIPRYINIGAGDFFHPYWHNIDTPNDYYADRQKKGAGYIQYDISSKLRLPFNDNSIKVAYISHVIEHISNEDVSYLFQEVHRCLQPGGFFRITCPDIDLEYDAFCRRDLSFFYTETCYGLTDASIEQRFLDHFATGLTASHPFDGNNKLTDAEINKIFLIMPKEQALDYIVSLIPTQISTNIQKNYVGDHINWFNSEKVKALLYDLQFGSIYDSRFGQSKCSILRNTQLFDYTCPWLSLYVEAQK